MSALEALNSGLGYVRASGPADMMSDDVRTCLDALAETTGETATEEIIDRIFERFCVGK